MYILQCARCQCTNFAAQLETEHVGWVKGLVCVGCGLLLLFDENAMLPFSPCPSQYIDEGELTYIPKKENKTDGKL